MAGRSVVGELAQRAMVVPEVQYLLDGRTVRTINVGGMRLSERASG